MPSDGRGDGRVRQRLLERGDLRVDGGDARPRGVDFLGPCARLQAPHGLACRRARAPPRPDALLRHLRPRRRIVALLARAGIAPQQVLEARQIPGAASSSARGGLLLGLRGRDLRLRLADVLGARAREQQPQLRVGLAALGPRASQRELGVGRLEARNRLAGLNASPSTTRSSTKRPPTSERHWTSVASTCPEKRGGPSGPASTHATTKSEPAGTRRGSIEEDNAQGAW